MYTELKKKNILVIGDVMLDTYYKGDVKRISPEAPVPVFLKCGERSTLGGAANVAGNLIAAGQSASIMTIIGVDSYGKAFLKMLEENKIDSSLILLSESRNTTVKTRFLTSNHQQLLRFDIENTNDISKNEEIELIEKLKIKIFEYDLIILSDYMKGLLTYSFTQNVIKLAKKNNIKVIVDVKDPRIEKYNGAFLLKPNLKEVGDLTGMPAKTLPEIVEASKMLCDRCSVQYVLTTCGDQGMILVNTLGEYSKVNSTPVEVYDVTGAGDTVIAYLGTCIANGLDIDKSIFMANIAAGIQVSKVGTSSVLLSEVERYIIEHADKHESMHKQTAFQDAYLIKKRNPDKKIVFTNGCFDILHIGHIRYLEKAATMGDILVVGVNSDASVKKLKGEERPINNENDRVELLAALSFVDHVVIFDNDTPYELIKAVQPDVLVKGADYKLDEVVGKDIVQGNGGRVELIKFVDGKSTTNVINKIKHNL
ncbi:MULTISPECIES: D-glycero-beta-D-manno-heptose 1-phosphate adenylyltransferase [unclassified Clostridium]|uniref:D-glycero-beta-D-manno-heptose 1-phosphate adenylyltransferase n=1 Tax=unclassified Clostridium TaxID=2614128 RepID=UPI000297B669|nr:MULTISPECIES: D-glycero-beta-D-manno-heptose 1-phosphate adenylyltransferase [unclassified Clostridium]EKQ56971.1 MAG: D-heptose-1-phosphate adenylyltransferase [Clostridium sp. Maddingley MBC34-26]